MDRADTMLAMAFAAVIAIAALLSIVNVPDEVVGFLIGIGGMFARNIGTAFDYEFGSSKGSYEKDKLLSKGKE